MQKNIDRKYILKYNIKLKKRTIPNLEKNYIGTEKNDTLYQLQIRIAATIYPNMFCSWPKKNNVFLYAYYFKIFAEFFSTNYIQKIANID